MRIKYVEPGIQSRWCDRCQKWRYFILEPMEDPKFPDVLRLRWMTDLEATEYEESNNGNFTLDDLIEAMRDRGSIRWSDWEALPTAIVVIGIWLIVVGLLAGAWAR